MTTSIFIPDKRVKFISNTYPDLIVPRIIANNNPTRGVIFMTVFDSLDPFRPNSWTLVLTGGYTYLGEGAKYFPLLQLSTNVVSVTPTVPGYEYDIVDVFGNTYHIILNGAMNFDPTLQLTAGPGLVGSVTIKSLLFSYSDIPPY